MQTEVSAELVTVAKGLSVRGLRNVHFTESLDGRTIFQSVTQAGVLASCLAFELKGTRESDGSEVSIITEMPLETIAPMSQSELMNYTRECILEALRRLGDLS